MQGQCLFCFFRCLPWCKLKQMNNKYFFLSKHMQNIMHHILNPNTVFPYTHIISSPNNQPMITKVQNQSFEWEGMIGSYWSLEQ
jgi:hypothetical protein